MTVEEELDKLEEGIRRLKIEYETYFAGGSPRAPRDAVFRVENTIKRYNSEIGQLNFAQRFRFNQLAQRYAVYNDLWRRKLRESEEGRVETARGEAKPPASQAQRPLEPSPFRIVVSDPENEREKVSSLREAYLRAKRQAGESGVSIDPELFSKFVDDKTRQIREALGCKGVEFSVSVDAGKVKLKAAGA